MAFLLAAVLMPVKIPPIQCHKYATRGQFYRRRRIDPETFATSIPVKYNMTVFDLNPAIFQIAVASLIKAKSVGGDLDEIFIRAPGPEVDEVFFKQWTLTARRNEDNGHKNEVVKLELHEYFGFTSKMSLKRNAPLATAVKVVLKALFTRVSGC